MPRYPKRSLEEKLAWMRDRQIEKKAEEEARAGEERRRAQLAVGAVGHTAPPALPVERQMLRVRKVADLLAVSHMTVRRWFAKRAVIAHPGARRTTMLIPVEALDEWLREHGPPNSR